ncbi:MAG: permease [Alphaproteobacteria bacterium]|nr:permease [Alphaproteobacteria bacterium]
MNGVFSQIGQALLMAFGMFWGVAWSLVLGFFISSIVQVYVSKERLQSMLGSDGPRQIALATGLGAISSSCSYASASVTRTLFRKGAGLITSLAFLFASTNLVIELGIVLFLLMGWQFMAAEWLGGIALVIVMSLLVRLTYPRKLVEEARKHAAQTGSKYNHPPLAGGSKSQSDFGEGSEETPSPAKTNNLLRKSKFSLPLPQGERDSINSHEALEAVARHFVMDWIMLWKDLLAGFLIAGFLSTFVPNSVWQALFVTDAHPAVQVPLNAMIGPLIAVVSFVCSIGNVPMAAVLWGSGISFGGVLAFIYADLIVLPLLDVYRRYFGWKMAAYIAVIFYVTMVLTGILMDLAFTALGFVPQPSPHLHAEITHFAFNYTFWLNLAFGAVALVLVRLALKKPLKAPPCCGGHGH